MIDILEISKALSNRTRLNILQWLKSPAENFPPIPECAEKPVTENGGVCVSRIQAKCGSSQSTISSYLDILQRAGLLLSEREGKWTYYRRNEKVIQEFAEFIQKDL